MPRTPTSVTGLLQWWRADNLTGAAGTGVTAWASAVGGPTLTPAATAASPATPTVATVGGHKVVRFASGQAARLTATGLTNRTQPYTMVLLATPTGAQANRIVWHYDNGPEIGTAGSSQWTTYVGASLTAPTSRLNTPTVVTVVANGATSALYQSGTVAASGNVGTRTSGSVIQVGDYVNGARPFVGDVYELLVYDHALTATERAAVHSYLQDRYGVTVSDYTPEATGPAWSLWNGTSEQPLTVEGVWNGSTITPATGTETAP